MSDFENNHDDNASRSAIEGEVKTALAALRHDQFAPGFEDRAVQRWNRERSASSNTFLLIERRAWQLLPMAIAASLMLAVYSAGQSTTPNASWIARTLGWHAEMTVASQNAAASDTYESVYSALYGLSLVNSSTGAR